MAINNTGAMFKSFEFDGTDSRNFGVYITGAAVYDAPEREVEMISIPNRNGAFALDKGRFENIEITYPAGIYADTEADFAEAISDLRNFLCSKRGYCRLTDEYNPNEYRMAIYKSGLEVEPALLKAGEFEITFECMPQRFLLSGEGKITLTSGQTVTNPTLFPSKPMLEVSGYGDININNDAISVDNGPIGWIVVAQKQYTLVVDIDDTYANVGDFIESDQAKIAVPWEIESGYVNSPVTASANNGGFIDVNNQHYFVLFNVSLLNQSFVYGTASTKTTTASISMSTSNYGTLTGSILLSYAYNGIDEFTITVTETVPAHFTSRYNGTGTVQGPIKLNSSKSSLGNPIYIDLDIGEAYKIENDSLVSVNNAVSIPPELPTLASGSNTITFDNTFTKVDLIPRWWKV